VLGVASDKMYPEVQKLTRSFANVNTLVEGIEKFVKGREEIETEKVRAPLPFESRASPHSSSPPSHRDNSRGGGFRCCLCVFARLHACAACTRHGQWHAHTVSVDLQTEKFEAALGACLMSEDLVSERARVDGRITALKLDLESLSADQMRNLRSLMGLEVHKTRKKCCCLWNRERGVEARARTLMAFSYAVDGRTTGGGAERAEVF